MLPDDVLPRSMAVEAIRDAVGQQIDAGGEGGFGSAACLKFAIRSANCNDRCLSASAR